MKRLEMSWYRGGIATLPLLPLAWLFGLVIAARRFAYRAGWLTRTRVAAPVIVVGNITVGGTGKTPLVIWLAQWLAQQGWRPGIVCRGYKGKADKWPQIVTARSDPGLVGDEPVLLARRTGCAVAAGPDRVTAAQMAIGAGCNILVADDGLQHYALVRDIEIAVVDGERRFGNGQLLPAGPLREPVSRLGDVDLVVANGAAQADEYPMTLAGETFYRLDGAVTRPAAAFHGRRLHAIAGTGNPARFFDHLSQLGLTFVAHAFPDHHVYTIDEVRFEQDAVVVMTEKDAVKFPPKLDGEYWYLPVDAQLDPRFIAALAERMKGLRHRG